MYFASLSDRSASRACVTSGLDFNVSPLQVKKGKGKAPRAGVMVGE